MTKELDELKDMMFELQQRYKRDQEDSWTMIKSICEDNHLLHQNLILCADKIRELTLEIEKLKDVDSKTRKY